MRRLAKLPLFATALAALLLNGAPQQRPGGVTGGSDPALADATPAAAAAVAPAEILVVGTISSTAPILIDGVSMDGRAASSWPLAGQDQVASTTAAALLVTHDQNLVILDPFTEVRVSAAGRETYLYLRKGGLDFETRQTRLFICAAGYLFVPEPLSKGYVRLADSQVPEATFLVDYQVTAGAFMEVGDRGCDEQGLAWLLTSAGPGVAGAVGGAAGAVGAAAGTAAAGAGAAAAGAGATAAGAAAAAGTAVAGTAAGAAAAAGTAVAAAGAGISTVAVTAGAVAAAAGSAAAVSAAGSGNNTCTSPDGCNGNPAPLSPANPPLL